MGPSDLEKVIPELHVPGVELTPTSLTFKGAPLDVDAWLEAGKRILTVHSAVQWWIGDWLNEGEAFYADVSGSTVHYEKHDGETVHYAIRGADVRSPETAALNLVSGYSRDTLLEFKRVARIFDKPIRIGTLTWGHHQVAATLPTAEVRQAALEDADRIRLSVAKFRTYVRLWYPNGVYTPTPDWRTAKDRAPAPTPDRAVCDALDFIDGLSAKITKDEDTEVFFRRLIDELGKRLAEMLFDMAGSQLVVGSNKK